MEKHDRSLMKDAISEVLETMFFVFVDFDDGLAVRQLGECESQISLSGGEGSVDISLMASQEFARMISANLLGVEENEVTSDDLEDTMKEFANMVGGNFKVRIDSSNQWELGIPHFRLLAAAEGSSGSGVVFSCFGRPMGEVTWNCV